MGMRARRNWSLGHQIERNSLLPVAATDFHDGHCGSGNISNSRLLLLLLLLLLIIPRSWLEMMATVFSFRFSESGWLLLLARAAFPSSTVHIHKYKRNKSPLRMVARKTINRQTSRRQLAAGNPKVWESVGSRAAARLDLKQEEGAAESALVQ